MILPLAPSVAVIEDISLTSTNHELSVIELITCDVLLVHPPLTALEVIHIILLSIMYEG